MRLIPNERIMLILLGLVWAELSLLPVMAAGPVKPDLYFVFLVFYAFRIDWRKTLPLAVMLGLSKDLLSNVYFGLETASYTSAAIMLQFFSVRFDRDKLWVQLASLFSVSWSRLVFYLIYGTLVHAGVPGAAASITRTFMIAGYTVLLGVLVFPAFEKWLRPRLQNKQYELFQ